MSVGLPLNILPIKTTLTFLANFMLIGAMNPVLADTLANRSAANWKFVEKVVGLILSLQGDSHWEEASRGT